MNDSKTGLEGVFYDVIPFLTSTIIESLIGAVALLLLISLFLA